MSHDMAGFRGRRIVLGRSVLVAALGLAATGAAAQSSNALPHCTPAGGSIMTNFVTADTTLGTATGDLRGAVSATLLGVAPAADSTVVFTIQHHWTTDAGDTVEMKVAEAKATEVAPGLFAILSYPVSITGGTGRFAGASGTVSNIGAVDLNTQRTVFRYQGDVCFTTPLK
jgi:hypothetical protein